MLNEDFREMLSKLSEEGVEYLLVGAYALAAHGLPRATGDMDLWIRCSAKNSAAAWRALARFGAPMDDIAASDLSTSGQVIQVGVAPCRIDLLTSIEGVDFDEAWPRRMTVDLEGHRVAVLSRRDLIQNKRVVGRPQDLADLDALGEADKE